MTDQTSHIVFGYIEIEYSMSPNPQCALVYQLHGPILQVLEPVSENSAKVTNSRCTSLLLIILVNMPSTRFILYNTSLPSSEVYQVWIKPNGEMPFLYGNHVVKAHLGRITEDTPEHQGVVIYNMNDIPLVRAFSCCITYAAHFWKGFGVTARSTLDTRKLDPTAIVVFHQAYVVWSLLLTLTHVYDSDVGEYLRDEVSYLSWPRVFGLLTFLLRIHCSRDVFAIWYWSHCWWLISLVSSPWHHQNKIFYARNNKYVVSYL